MEVKVWNDNTHLYSELFKGQNIVIEPGQHILMQEDDAILFLGTMPPQGILADGDGNPDPRGYKKLRIQKLGEVEKQQLVKGVKDDKLVCHRCKYVAASEGDLDEHVMANHMEELINADEVKSKMKK